MGHSPSALGSHGSATCAESTGEGHCHVPPLGHVGSGHGGTCLPPLQLPEGLQLLPHVLPVQDLHICTHGTREEAPASCPVHPGPSTAPSPLRGAHGRPSLTCKGRALSPGPPAVRVVSICKRTWWARTPSPSHSATPAPAVPQATRPAPQHAHSQVARYHWWKSCSLVAPFLLRFCPGASSTQAGTE